MRFNENEEAVSPVIGVILMVAITVILAAVIAVFVFGMANDVETTKTVAATAKINGDDIIVTYQGGPDAEKVSWINSTIYTATGSIATNGSGGTSAQTSKQNPSVGYSVTFDSAGHADGDERVVITAEFDDGTTQVLLDKTL